jgi:DNA-binding XRE family transcriptional regulator
MANNLGKLRKEFKLTQSDLADLLETSSTNIGYYEQEKRDFSTKLLIKLSDMFKASIDYILGIRDDGIFIYFEGESILEYRISEEKLNEYLAKKVVYYKDDSYRRYININELLGLKSALDLSSILQNITSLDELENILGELPISSRDDLDKLYSLEKIKSLSKEKIHAVKKLLEFL